MNYISKEIELFEQLIDRGHSLDTSDVTNINHYLKNISDMLLLNGTLTDCPGLIHGKMGIAIFFFHYARYTENDLFEEYAIDLIEEIQNQIHLKFSTNYERGLSGIGIGIEYLAQNGFIDSDTDEILEDVDEKIYRTIMDEPYSKYDLYNGLSGLGRYWLYRFAGNQKKNRDKKVSECLNKIFNILKSLAPVNISDAEKIDIYCFLQDMSKSTTKVKKMVEQYRQIDCIQHPDSSIFSHLGDSIMGNLIKKHLYQKYLQIQCDNKFESNNIIISNKDNLSIIKTGILNGYAGYGLSILSYIDPKYQSWFNLM